MIYLPQPTDLCVIADVRSLAQQDISPMPIYQIAITAPGSYSVAPTASVVPGTGIGSGLTLGAVTLSAGGVLSVAVTAGGSYTQAPLIQFTGGTGSGATGLAYFSADNLIQRFVSEVSQEFLSLSYRPQILPFAATETRNGSGSPRMALKYWPVISVQSVTIGGTTSVPLSVNGVQYGYVCDGNSILIVGGGGWWGGIGTSFSAWPWPGSINAFPRGYQNIALAYTFGYSAIPYDIQGAVIELAATRWQRKGHLDQDSVGIGQPAQTTKFSGLATTKNFERVVNRYAITPVMEL